MTYSTAYRDLDKFMLVQKIIFYRLAFLMQSNNIVRWLVCSHRLYIIVVMKNEKNTFFCSSITDKFELRPIKRLHLPNSTDPYVFVFY